jgi:hypothetical protein
MGTLFNGGLAPHHPDYEVLRRLEQAIIRHSGGLGQFRTQIPILLRQAIDEVIDTPRSGRFTLDEIEKTEKTYIGTKIEILLRNYLKMEKGSVMDLSIDGTEVDIKNTIGSNWTIPSEAMGHPCILLKAEEKRFLCSFGLIVIREEALNPGRNRDGKRTISRAGFANVHWVIRDQPYPENFWQTLPSALKNQIASPRGGTERVASLFRLVQGRPISRLLIQGLTQQHDYMKRIRRNGGARDLLAPLGIAILWGQKDKDLIRRLRLPTCGADEFISFMPRTPDEAQLLQNAKHID